jgi:hypothetical protein
MKRMGVQSVGKSTLLIRIFKRKNGGGNSNIKIMEIVVIVFGVLVIFYLHDIAGQVRELKNMIDTLHDEKEMEDKISKI